MNETPDAFRVFGKFGGQNFDGDEPFEFDVFGKINFAHSARAEQRFDRITIEFFADEKAFGFGDDVIGDVHDCRLFHKIVSRRGSRQQGFDRKAQFFVAAGKIADQLRAFGGLVFRSPLKNSFDLLVFFLIHKFAAPPSS